MTTPKPAQEKCAHGKLIYERCQDCERDGGSGFTTGKAQPAESRVRRYMGQHGLPYDAEFVHAGDHDAEVAGLKADRDWLQRECTRLADRNHENLSALYTARSARDSYAYKVSELEEQLTTLTAERDKLKRANDEREEFWRDYSLRASDEYSKINRENELARELLADIRGWYTFSTNEELCDRLDAFLTSSKEAT